MKINLEQKTSSGFPEKKTFLEKIRSRIDKRLQALAVAGFLTMGLASDAQADQLKFVKSEKAAPHFVMEGEVEQEKLGEFKEKIKREEPEFFVWVEEYISSSKNSIDAMAAQINSLDPQKDEKEEKEFLEVSKKFKVVGLIPGDMVKQNHKIMEKLRSNKDFSRMLGTLKDSLNDIIWRYVMIDDSRAVRNETVEHVATPEIRFKYHQIFELDRSLAITSVRPHVIGEKLKADIELSPASFMYHDSKVDLNLFFNTLVHELDHAMHPGSQKQGPGLMTGLQMALIEGLAQNATFEVMQTVAHTSGVSGLRPEVGMNGYDELIVISSITDAIIRSSSTPDVLAKWHAGLITEQEFITQFKSILDEVGLDSGIAVDLARLSSQEKETEIYSPVTKAYESMLARLKISGYTLSPQFVESILTSGRKADAVQKSNVGQNLKTSKLNDSVSSRIKKIQTSEPNSSRE